MLGGAEGVVCHLHVTGRGNLLVEDDKKNNAKTLKERITWDYLIQNFNEKYIPESARDRLFSEFLELKQGQMIVSQYNTKFTQLSRYAEGLVRNEADRTKKFIKGLKAEIRSKLIPLQLKVYMRL